MADLDSIKETLRAVVDAGQAHIGFEASVDGLPWERTGDAAPEVPHTIFTLVWHMDACMRDIIDWVEAEAYRERPYPTGYWPGHPRPAAESEWRVTVEQAKRSIARVRDWVDSRDLLAPLERNPDHTVARQILVVGKHNSYHIGQIVAHRMAIGLPVRDF